MTRHTSSSRTIWRWYGGSAPGLRSCISARWSRSPTTANYSSTHSIPIPRRCCRRGRRSSTGRLTLRISSWKASHPARLTFHQVAASPRAVQRRSAVAALRPRNWSSIRPERSPPVIFSIAARRKLRRRRGRKTRSVFSAARFERPIHRHGPQLFENFRHLQHAKVIEPMADDLDPDRQMTAVERHAYGGGGLAGLIEHGGEQRVLERPFARDARLLRRKIHHRQRRCDHIVKVLERGEQCGLRLADLAQRPIDIDTGMLRAAKAPLAHIVVDVALAVGMRRQ